jgi:hypothetical protein
MRTSWLYVALAALFALAPFDWRSAAGEPAPVDPYAGKVAKA